MISVEHLQYMCHYNRQELWHGSLSWEKLVYSKLIMLQWPRVWGTCYINGAVIKYNKNKYLNCMTFFLYYKFKTLHSKDRTMRQTWEERLNLLTLSWFCGIHAKRELRYVFFCFILVKQYHKFSLLFYRSTFFLHRLLNANKSSRLSLCAFQVFLFYPFFSQYRER